MQSLRCVNPYWQNPGTYYVGFRFNTGAGPQYGWVRIKWGGCPRNDFEVKDYAWGDVGDRIKTGQRRSKDDAAQAVPRSEAAALGAAPAVEAEGSLGLLALGAIGLQAWRKRRQVVRR